MRIKIFTTNKIQFLLAIIMFIFMTINFATDIYIFAQIAATIAFVNFIVSTVNVWNKLRLEKQEVKMFKYKVETNEISVVFQSFFSRGGEE